MKALLKFLYFLVFLIVIFLLAGIFFPGSYSVSNKMLVKASPDLVFDLLKNADNWELWLPELIAEENPEFTYTEQMEGAGAAVSWNTKMNTIGSLKLSSVVKDSLTTFDLNLEPYSIASINFRYQAKENFTTLSYNYQNQGIKYFERYLMLFYEPAIKASLDKTIKAIGEKAEALRLSRYSEPNQVGISTQDYMIIADTASVEEVYTRSIEILERLERYLELRKIQITGDPITILYTYPPGEQTHFACGYPIPKRTWGWRDYQCIRIDTTQALATTHYGLFTSVKPYVALEDYASMKGLKPDTFLLERYIQTPLTNQDTSLWQKEILLPLREE